MNNKHLTPSTRKKRSTATRGTLKRFNNIDDVKVEIPFKLSAPQNDATLSAQIKAELGNIKGGNDTETGDGCYVSATVHNRRYYGVLVDQASLRAASVLHFHDEAEALDLNKRIKLKQISNEESQKKDQEFGEGSEEQSGEKRPPFHLDDNPKPKRAKNERSYALTNVVGLDACNLRPIQKLRYVEPNSGPGYRILVATYVDVLAAAEDHLEKASIIEAACQSGGDFVSGFYYQYEALSNTLKCAKVHDKRSDVGFRTSMGLQSFLRDTELPECFPLSNLEGGQNKVLNMLNFKKSNKGGLIIKAEYPKESGGEKIHHGTAINMEPRDSFRVGVVGAGIAGLACAVELFRLAALEQIDLEVVLLEGRSRVGGRLWTDETTFTSGDEKSPFPVDLGASWIHGIDHNPLAALAKKAGIDFVTASEEVKMLGPNMEQVDQERDERMGKFFDDILDKAADDVWDKEDYASTELRSQDAVRWYAMACNADTNLASNGTHSRTPLRNITDAPKHRHSSDVSIDHAMGNAIAKHKKREFSRLSDVENSLLLWNTKNVEYALGANICDLSMKFWDSDDRHAFEGDHVLLKQGYSAVTKYLLKSLEENGDKFKCVLDFPVHKIQYARKTTCRPYVKSIGKRIRYTELSDTCCVTSRVHDQKYNFDFAVCTLPLGILKESVAKPQPSVSTTPVSFEPPLPSSKIDAIENVGFGLLNKVYLQFPVAFWRIKSVFENDQTLFGNATGLNPHHYMFFDVGKSLGSNGDGPPVLMTLISGAEAVKAERMPEADLIMEVMATLRKIFSSISVPNPVASKSTKWGSDSFSRGCYTFLPPGASDQDFQILQSPINENGDSLLLEGNETMRLFWAGEHTTALHPSMAHGAMLSGIRAAGEVLNAMRADGSAEQMGMDKLIPLAVFRRKNPDIPLNCGLCHRVGSRVREGSLLAFQRGARQVLTHNNCAEYSPEVEVKNGKWKNVIKAVNRGKQINCSLCKTPGGTVGCTHASCFKSFHYSCCEDTGWRFERDGKVFLCDLHRSSTVDNKSSECDQISFSFFQFKNPLSSMKCALCDELGDNMINEKMLAFQRNNRRVVVHEKCVTCTTIVDTANDDGVDGINSFKNIFEAVALSKTCVGCNRKGATVQCSELGCSNTYHFPCANATGWDVDNKVRKFKCNDHREKKRNIHAKGLSDILQTDVASTNVGGLFNHDLFHRGASTMVTAGNQSSAVRSRPPQFDLPSNAQFSSFRLPSKEGLLRQEDPNTFSASEEEESSDDELEEEVMTLPLLLDQSILSKEFPERKKEEVSVMRPSMEAAWGLSFSTRPSEVVNSRAVLVISIGSGSASHGLNDGDVVLCINAIGTGSESLKDLKGVLSFMAQTIGVSIEVLRESEAS